MGIFITMGSGSGCFLPPLERGMISPGRRSPNHPALPGPVSNLLDPPRFIILLNERAGIRTRRFRKWMATPIYTHIEMYRVTANMLIMSLPTAYVHASMRQGRDSIKTFPTSELLLFTAARTDGMDTWTLDRIFRRRDARSSASSHPVVSFEQCLLCSLCLPAKCPMRWRAIQAFIWQPDQRTLKGNPHKLPANYREQAPNSTCQAFMHGEQKRR